MYIQTTKNGLSMYYNTPVLTIRALQLEPFELFSKGVDMKNQTLTLNEVFSSYCC